MKIIFSEVHRTSTHHYPAGVLCEVDEARAMPLLESGVAKLWKPEPERAVEPPEEKAVKPGGRPRGRRKTTD